ncbi:MAG: type II 3-dehydroquinate dehydratase [Flavobacteriales bacterium]|nr:type II 3-dehydroquinate dehydratase [Flavobacteriales bacterium]
MKVIIINGPNLNLLGLREKSIYGEINFIEYFNFLKNKFPNIKLSYFQSNIEGEIVDKIHEVGFSFDYIILNAAAYTHTSIAIADALDPITTPVIEVHISNIYSREEFRRKSLISKNCKSVICGFGLDSYKLALYSIDH